MKACLHWGLFVLMWLCGVASRSLWPQHNQVWIEGEMVWNLVFYHFFHYLLSFLFCIIFFLLVSLLFKRMLREYRISRLFRRIPYQSFILLILVGWQLGIMLLFFRWLALLLCLLMLTELILRYRMEQKQTVEHVQRS